MRCEWCWATLDRIFNVYDLVKKESKHLLCLDCVNIYQTREVKI